MCTITWWSDSKRYELFFNRDELKSRKIGLKPRLHDKAGVPYICPRDPDGGGTWILVNHFGLTVCLLNQYPPALGPLQEPLISRGRLVESLANHSNLESITQHLQATDLTHYQAFLLVALKPGSDGCLFLWDTYKLTVTVGAKVTFPVTTSSLLPEEVIQTRQDLFAAMLTEGKPTPEKLRDFHHYSIPEAPSHSVFMQRPDSETVSLCQIKAGPNAISMTYQPKESGASCFGAAFSKRLIPQTCSV